MESDAHSESGTSVADPTSSEPDYPINVDFSEPSEGTNKAAQLQYGILGAVQAAAAGLVAAAALQMPEALLSPAAAADPWATTLVGLLAATHLRLSGIFFHLSNAAGSEELLCLRHQRLAIATAAYGLVAVLSQAFGVASAQLVGAQLVLGAVSAAVVLNVARSAWSVRPFISTVELEGDFTFSGTVWASIRAAGTWFSTVSGTFLVAVMGLSLAGFFAVVTAPAPILPQSLGSWPGDMAALDAASAGLRRLASAGLLLLAAHAHALMDLAVQARRPASLDNESGIKQFLLERLIRTRDPYAKYYLPNPWNYRHLHLTFVLAALLQAFFVLRAPSLGVDVNTDGPFWGAMFGTGACSLLYGLSAVMLFDWSAASDAVLRFTIWSTGLVLRFFDAFVWKVKWAEKAPRK